MGSLRSMLSRVAAMFRRRELDERIDDELLFHIEMQTEENIRQGMSPSEARRQARIECGGVEQVKELHRDVRGWPFLESLLRDVLFALRSLRRSPGTTAAALITLTFGIGIGTTIFSLVYAVLLRPLPYREPDRLVMLWNVDPKKGENEYATNWIAVTEFFEWQKQTDLFERVATFHDSFSGIMTSLSPPERVTGQQFGPGFFELLGVQPLIGRPFTPEEERTRAPVVLLQYELWQRSFAGDPDIVGKTIRVGANDSRTVIGVMPQNFRFFSRTTQVLVPLGWDRVMTQLSWRNLMVVARLKDGVSLEQAQDRVNVLSPQLGAFRQTGIQGSDTRLVPITEIATEELEPALLALLGAAAGVLLIMCANLANLLLVKANGRAKELAVRAAMGASRGRIVRMLLTESLLLSAAGCVLGLALCATLLPLIQTVLPGPRSADYGAGRLLVQFDAIGLDGAVALFAVGCSLCSGLVFGLLPALRCSRPNLDEDLKDVGHGSSGRRAPRVVRVLAVAQVAVSLTLVVGATMLVRSVLKLYHQGPGFQAEGLLRVTASWPEWAYAGVLPASDAPRGERDRVRTHLSRTFIQDVFEAVSAVPGVKSVAAGGRVGSNIGTGPVAIEGSSADPWSEPRWANDSVTPNYFTTMGIPLLAGRMFNTSDRPETTRVVLINCEAADRFWPNTDPIGKRIRWVRFSKGDDWLTIVGVVGNVRYFGMDQPPPPTVYYSNTQWAGPLRGTNLMVRADSDPNTVARSIITAIRGVHPDTLIGEVRQVQGYVDDLSWRRRLAMRLLAGLAALALLLATVGVYGVLSSTVTEKTREIGIRMALGADRGAVIGTVLRQGLAIAVLGLGIGLVMTVVLTRFLQNLLFGVEPIDPASLAISAGALLAATLLASYFPARRATRVDPLAALRHD